ncbi:MAG: hypothetical protein M0Q94_16310 [Candidatus Cloacimonetes bacterium]|nr:hypothetical protein [Candidatus Cloacimonadota bacterium]
MEYLTEFYINYPDIVRVAMIPMIIAILAIALPLLIQTISRIEDKYNSTKLIVVFKKEFIYKSFWIILFLSILSFICWVLQLPRIVDFGVFNYIVDKSAFLFITISTIFLVIATLRLFGLILTYYQTEKLLNRLTRKYKKSIKTKRKRKVFRKISNILIKAYDFIKLKSKKLTTKLTNWLKTKRKRNNKTSKETLYFEAVSSILFFSIQKADEPLSRKLLEFYFDCFISFRKDKKDKIIEYPQEYYDTVFEANGLLCLQKRRPISYFNDSTLFALFIDEFQGTKLSPTTYQFLWKLIIQSLYYDRDDFIFSYWKKAHQLFNLFLKPVDNEFNDKWEVINTEQIKERESERQEFLELHYAIGGYLMYLEKYKLLKKIIYWTNQTPPKYVLVPETMQEVITKYMEIAQKAEYKNPVYFEQKYPYPEVSGVSANEIIRMWIKRYISILFLRQYTLHSYYTFFKPLEMPSAPKELSEKKRWDDELDSLKRFVGEYLGNDEILKQLKFEDLANNQWFVDNDKETPDSLIDNLKYEIKEEFVKIKDEQGIDPQKEKVFQEKTVSIINSVFSEYSNLFQQDNHKDNYKSFYISGRYQLMDKAGFASNQEISYLNSDSIVAESVAIELRNMMLNGYALMKKITYKLNDIDIFPAVDKLEINPNDYILIAIGLNLEYYLRLGITNLKNENDNWSYNGFTILNINNSMNDLVSHSLFVLRKADMPNALQIDVPQEIKDKYRLDELDSEKHIFGKILDLHAEENKAIREEVELKSEESNLSQKVIVCVDLRTEVRYKINTICVQLKSFMQFIDRGLVNKLSDIKTFNIDE